MIKITNSYSIKKYDSTFSSIIPYGYLREIMKFIIL